MMVNDLFDRYSHLLQELDQPWLSPENLQLYALALLMGQLGQFADHSVTREQFTMAIKGLKNSIIIGLFTCFHIEKMC